MIRDIFLAFRNLARQKKRSILLAGAIAFGLMIVSLINGFAGSFVRNVGENFSHLLAGHIFIEGVEKTASGKTVEFVRDDKIIIDAVDELSIPYTYITKRSDFSGGLIFEGESLQQNIVGADWEKESYFKDRLVLKEGSFESMLSLREGLILSDKVASKLNVQLGDRILVKMTTITGQQNVGEFQLAAICYDPGLLSSSSGYANLSYVNELLALKEGEYKTLGLYLPEMDRMDLDAAKLYEVLKGKGVQLFDRGDKGTDANPVVAMMKQASDEKWEGIKFRLYTLNDLLAEVQQIVNVLNVASLVILLILFVIIMVGVTNTFRMVMYERTREIGTMRAIGMQKKEVKRLFLFEALFIALGGSLAGYILSGIIMFVLSRIYWGMDSAVFILLKNGYMTFSMQGWQVVVNVLLVSILTVLAAFFPARKAAALRPADALRSQK